MARRTTPARPVAVEELFPELVPFAQDTVRLHPRAGDPTFRDSSIGGPLLWPADEPWPICTQESPTEPTPMVAVAQVFRDDAPGIPFPPDTDVLQVLWCPFKLDGTPDEPQLYWRDSRTVDTVATAPEPPEEAEDDDLWPQPCVLAPETVTEYPNWDLPSKVGVVLADRFERLENDTGYSYHRHLSVAPGTKLGGYPGWNGTCDPSWPYCYFCNRRMHHLLTLGWEFDHQSKRTWMPVEERDIYDDNIACRDIINSTGILTDGSTFNLFTCRTCPNQPHDYRYS